MTCFSDAPFEHRPRHTVTYNRFVEYFGYITDHSYWGNVCSGFGGKVECVYIDFDKREMCGHRPEAHYYPKHRREDV